MHNNHTTCYVLLMIYFEATKTANTKMKCIQSYFNTSKLILVLNIKYYIY